MAAALVKLPASRLEALRQDRTRPQKAKAAPASARSAIPTRAPISIPFPLRKLRAQYRTERAPAGTGSEALRRREKISRIWWSRESASQPTQLNWSQYLRPRER